MPTITFRVSGQELERLKSEARTAGGNLSALVRRRLDLDGVAQVQRDERLDALEKRVRRIEELAERSY